MIPTPRHTPDGYLCLVLHAHLPWVRHPEWPDPLEERWLHEAIIECYLPLLEMLEGWERDGIEYRLTLSLSPTLLAMLSDPLLQSRCAQRLERLVQLAEQEVIRTRWMPLFNDTAWHYLGRLRDNHRRFTQSYRGDLPGAFGRLADAGRLELMTCNATHAFLPLFQHQPAIVQAQIAVGLAEFERQFGRRPAGFWCAECGYYPGLDTHLTAAGLGYTFLDAHGLTRGRSAADDRQPGRTPAGLAVFGRNVEAARQVWNARTGYPGDALYREFYRDAGFDLEYEYIRPFIHDSGLRIDTGFKYHRVTGPVALGEKAPYDWNAARSRAVHHAGDFIAQCLAQCAPPPDEAAPPRLITAPYDAELFGHWWYEGPIFLDHLMRRLHHNPCGLHPVTPGEYLQRHGRLPAVAPAFSSWGEGGYGGPWLNRVTEWIYPPLHAAGETMTMLARRYAGSDDETLRRVLNQMSRELLLAQSSDWAFMMTQAQAAQYGSQRTQEHLERFKTLDRQLHTAAIDREALQLAEARDSLFPALEFEVFTDSARP